MPRRQAQRVPETSTSRTYPRLLSKQDVRMMLQSMGVLIRIETSSSADSYGLLTSNTAVREEDVRCEAPPTGRPREHDAVTCGHGFLKRLLSQAFLSKLGWPQHGEHAKHGSPRQRSCVHAMCRHSSAGDGVVLTGLIWRLRSGPTRPHARLLPALVSRRGRTLSACDRGLGAQGLFEPIEMAATMHRPPQEARLPPHLDLRHQLR
jgi:hypothetical protein